MSLNLIWERCRDVERLDTESERWISFACGVTMMNAGIKEITEDTLPELMLWQIVVEDGSGLIFIDGKLHRLTVEDWIARVGMTANVSPVTVARRRTALHKRLVEQKRDEIKFARLEAVPS